MIVCTDPLPNVRVPTRVARLWSCSAPATISEARVLKDDHCLERLPVKLGNPEPYLTGCPSRPYSLRFGLASGTIMLLVFGSQNAAQASMRARRFSSASPRR